MRVPLLFYNICAGLNDKFPNLDTFCPIIGNIVYLFTLRFEFFLYFCTTFPNFNPPDILCMPGGFYTLMLASVIGISSWFYRGLIVYTI